MSRPQPDTWRADPTVTFYVGLAIGAAIPALLVLLAMLVTG